ncbi:tetratricopeptide repeat protein [Granulicella mallensis]|uniref:TPR domain protein n=1 Tax=Granulicella mallensis (strain ATCC BAA-1857 / DSM 23137 / MP5ACTX8) TaxID=682795 RepID=G8NY50_GRAMM|nr:tetratricopeptide repeat protein [Granulicella mallensis]AEU36724.1 TPR domain protein [Granulicella mallensis MP5ACTX8]
MIRPSIFFTIAFGIALGTAQAQQLPAGTHAADDHSREDAASARIQEAETALEHQDYKDASAKLKVLAAELPKDAHVLYDLGFAEERNGEEDAAALAYANAITADATLGEPRVALGLLDARAGRLEKAHQELQDAAALTSAAPELRGRALRALASMDQSSHPDAARDELLAAVKLTGEASSDTLATADLAARAGDNDDAETEFRRAIAADPQNIDAVAGLAHVLVQEKKSEEAETVLTSALKAHPNDPRLVSQLASVYVSEDKAQQAIPLVEQMRAADPQLAADDSTTRLLARLYGMNGQFEDSEKIYKTLVDRNPKDPSLLDDLADAFIQQQHYPEAQVLLEKAVGMRSNFATPEDWGEAAGHLAFAASKNHDPHVTLRALTARATVLPNSPSSLFLEATAHDTLHESKEAARAYRAFLTAANGKFPDQEFQARHRLIALQNVK